MYIKPVNQTLAGDASKSGFQAIKATIESMIGKAVAGRITGTGTTNELAYFTGTSTIGSLTTATYPSLAELSRLKGTLPFTDYSAISTIVGWSSFVTKQIYYFKISNLVFVWIMLNGTSNSTSTSFTLPYPLNSSQAAQGVIWGGDSAGATLPSRVRIAPSSNTATVDYNWNNAWTASGFKICHGIFFYIT